MGMCTLTYKNLVRNFDGMHILAHFPANFAKFQIFLHQSIFVLKKRLIYEKASILDRKYDEIKIK